MPIQLPRGTLLSVIAICLKQHEIRWQSTLDLFSHTIASESQIAKSLSSNTMPSLAAIVSVEATLRFRIRAIFLTGVLFFASPRSLCFSAAVHTLSSVRSVRSPRSRLLSASLFNPCVLIGARGGQAAGVMSMQT